jgi:hypothetical protein
MGSTKAISKIGLSLGSSGVGSKEGIKSGAQVGKKNLASIAIIF